MVPRQLPAPVAHFVGRSAELTTLTHLLDQRDADALGTVVISAIGGTAGVGKTELAVQWAHQLIERFPDGQLYVNLRGYDPAEPMAAADALAGFLRALGVPGQEIPPGEQERAARYRSLLDGRRVLIVLDNAGSAEQIRPLLPGSPACTAVVTSRDALAGLVARHGAVRLDLDLLPLADSVCLLRELIGERARADPDAVAALANRCARLPLALRVTAELAAARTADPLTVLAGELADQQGRLDLLDAGGDSRTAVRAVFSWSYRHLDAAAARAFRLAGLHPGTDFDGYALAALADANLRQARKMLDVLARAHLIQAVGPGRYRLHDLLCAYAREAVAGQETGQERRAALTRLFDHYLATAASATEAFYPGRRRQPRVSPAVTPAPPLDDSARAQHWLDSNRACLVASAIYCVEHGWPGHATRLAGTLFQYLHVSGHYPEAAAVYGSVLLAACQAGDRAAEAEALTGLGIIDFERGRYAQAAGRYLQALNLFRESGDRDGELRALHNLGGVDMYQGRCAQAAERARQAAALYRESGNKTGEALALNNLGFVDLRRGLYEQAAAHIRQALDLYRDSGDRSGEARALANLGVIETRQGRYPDAALRFRRALDLSRQSGSKAVTAYSLVSAGYLDLLQARYQQAGERHNQALVIYRQCGDRSGEAEALNGLGEVFLAVGRPGRSRDTHLTALAMATQIGDLYQQARAHHGLARAHQAIAGHDQARRHWQRALALYSGFPEAGLVRAELAAVGQDGRGCC